jgi:hypothetical protein
MKKNSRKLAKINYNPNIKDCENYRGINSLNSGYNIYADYK